MHKLFKAVVIYCILMINTVFGGELKPSSKEKHWRERSAFFIDLKNITEPLKIDPKISISQISYEENFNDFDVKGFHRFWTRYAGKFYNSYYRQNFNNYIDISQHPVIAIKEFSGFFESHSDMVAERRVLDSIDLPWRENLYPNKTYILGEDKNILENDLFFIGTDLKVGVNVENLGFLKDYLFFGADHKKSLEESSVDYSNLSSRRTFVYDEQLVNTLRFRANINVKLSNFKKEMIKSIGIKLISVFDNGKMSPINIVAYSNVDIERRDINVGVNIFFLI